MSGQSVTDKRSSADELRFLVAGLRPRSPHEVMGEAATSSLLTSTIAASIIGSLLVLLMTIVMFLFSPSPRPKDVNQNPVVAEKPVTNAASNPAVVTPASSAESVAADKQDTAVDTAVEAMGIGEAKDPNTSTQPLQSRLDELLDGLE